MALLDRLYVAYSTGIMYTFHYLWTALWTVVALPFAVLGLHPVTSLIVRIWSNGLFWAVFRHVHVEGRDHIDPRRTYLVTMNHTSMYDIPALMSLFPRVAWLGRDRMVRIPVFGFVLKRSDYISVFPGDVERSKESIRRAIEKSPQVSIAICPEGTRTLDGRLGPFKKGFTYIVEDTDLDVLPITVNGLFAWRPKYQKVLTPREKVRLVVHPPLSNAALRAMDRDRMAAHVREVIGSGLGQGEAR